MNEEILGRIEFAIQDLVEKLARSTIPRITLRTTFDESSHQVHYHNGRMMKFVFNLCTLRQVYQLLLTNRQSTKRFDFDNVYRKMVWFRLVSEDCRFDSDLYYDMKNVYKTQANLDRSVTTVCELLNVTRISINIISSSKGLLAGALCLLVADGSVIDCRTQPLLISEALMVHRIVCSARFILVVEKDATFQKLIDQGYFRFFADSLLVTGKGYPDICTRKVLRWLVDNTQLPVFGLFDADPHGVEILFTYKYGSMTEKAEGRGSVIKEMQWIGLRPSDAKLAPIATDQYLSMKNSDFTKLCRVRRRAQLLGETMFVNEMRLMRHKLELEAVSSIGNGYIVEFYLVPRIQAALESWQLKNNERQTAGPTRRHFT